MTEHPVVFECDGKQLLGIVHEPKESLHALGVLVVVGGPQYRVGSHRQFTLMARRLAARGYAVMRFDYRGMGDSEGEPRTFESVDADIRAAVDCFLKDVPALKGVILWGLCDAASAVMMYCAVDVRVNGLVLANPWVRTEAGEARAYLRHYYVQRLFERAFWTKLLSGKFNAMGSARDLLRKWAAARRDRSAAAVKMGFIERMYRGFERFDKPVLFLISDRDLTAREFMDLCGRESAWRDQVDRPNVRMFELRDADHTFSSSTALAAAVEQTCVWLGDAARRRHVGG